MINYFKVIIKEIISKSWLILIYILILILGINEREGILNKVSTHKDWIVIFILVVIIVELIIYKNSIVKYLTNILDYLIIGLGVCLIIDYLSTNQEITRRIISIVQLINLKVIINMDKKFKVRTKEGGIIGEEVCCYYDELFDGRKKQADSIISFIDSFDKSDRFTILLNGSWGEGKTSLIKGVEDKCRDKYEMIFIQPMMFDKRDLLIKYFIDRIKEILSEGNIYTGKGSSVENYCISLLNWVNKNSKIGFGDDFKSKEVDDFRKIKEDLQSDIKKYLEDKEDRRIIVIVDDFDRVDEKTVEEVLMFIREIIDFQGISTILLMEYSKIKSNKMTDEYLQKYIDVRLDINKITIEEMIRAFGKSVLESKKQYKIIEDRNDIIYTIINETIGNKIESDMENAFKGLKDSLDKIITDINKNKWDNNASKQLVEKLKLLELDKTITEKNIKAFQEFKNITKRNLKSVRLVKKIVRECMTAYYNIYYKSNESFSIDEGDIEFILKVIILKNLFVNEYEKLIKLNNSNVYFNQMFPDSIEKIFIDVFFKEVKSKKDDLAIINKYIIADAIVKSSFDEIKFETKTSIEKKIEMLDNWDVSQKNGIDCLENVELWEKEYEALFNLIWSDFLNGDGKQDIIERVYKLESIGIYYVNQNITNEKELLSVYERVIRIFERYEYYYSLIRSIYEIIISKVYSSGEIKEIIETIYKIRITNLNYLARVSNILIQLNNKEVTNNYYNRVSEFKEFVEKAYALDFEIGKEKLTDFEYIVKILKENIDKSNESKLLDKEYLNEVIKKVEYVEKYISEIEDGLDKKTIENKDITIEEKIRGCKDFDAYKEQIDKWVKDILQEGGKFNYDDFIACSRIVSSIENIEGEQGVRNILELIEKVIEKAKENRQPKYYTLLDLQYLIVRFEFIKERLRNNIK